MAQENLQSESIVRYIRQMSPQARAMLAQAMDHMQLSGETKQQLIADALYVTMKENGEISPSEMAKRAIMEPVEQFVVPLEGGRKRAAVIPRVHAEKIWRWLSEAIAVEMIDQVQEAYAQAGKVEKNDALVDAVQEDLSAQIYATLSAVQNNDKQRMRLIGQLGGEEALSDLREVALLLKHRKFIMAMMRNLRNIAKFNPDEKHSILKQRLDTIHARAPEIFPFVLVQVKNELKSIAKFLRFIVFSTGTRESEVLARGSHAHAGRLVMADLERMVSQIQALVKTSDSVAISDTIKEFGLGVRALETEFDVSPSGEVGQGLKELRADMARAVWHRLADFMPRLLRLVQPRLSDRASIHILEKTELDRLEVDARILMSLRNYANELALSAVTSQTVNEMKQALENGIPALIDRLRNENGAVQTSLKDRISGAIQISEYALGGQYAQIQRRAMEIALLNDAKSTRA